MLVKASRDIRGPRRLSAATLVIVGLALSACSNPTSPLTATRPATNVGGLTVVGTVLLTSLGQTSQLTAKTAAGTVVTSGLTWQSFTSAVATVSATGLVTAIGLGSATIQAKTSDALGTATIFVVAPATATTTLSACGQIIAPGSYVLGGDLPPTASSGCLQIQTVAVVQLDCRGHVVPTLALSNVNTVTISNCSVTGALVITNANSVKVTNCTVAGAVSVLAATSVVIANSTISAPASGAFAITVVNGTNVELLQDTISNNARGSSAVYLLNGVGNQVLQSTIGSSYDGGQLPLGTDDGILVINETGDTIQGNTIKNFWDAAVEGVDLVANTTVADNTVSNVGAAGIGSYWCTNWTGDVVRNNDVSLAPTLLLVNYLVGLGQCGPASLSVAFSSNQFIGNRFRSPIAGTLQSLPAPGGSTSTQGPAARMIVTLPGTVTGNLLQANDLGSNDGPFVSPSQGFIDGGGNICGPTNPAVSNFACTGAGSVAVGIGPGSVLGLDRPSLVDERHRRR
jgi:Right handed beta helix region/Bacterial Ig-like domain (group 2)